jgi:F0F1-type ATP synthase assembly protein I
MKLKIAGWMLFIVSAFAFTVSSIRNGDSPALIGSLAFLFACFVFLASLLRSRKKD